ncbi:OprO/OprP family phosphate-selective porin [Luteimonas aestuarii]|uniref:OprO/OprP family phosphate-selective porin n=1 Tax=Luteimonas aestuarii TaxID=453837 RepID=UPI0014044D37|nr:porin [Luteimonas aestuarii]
MSKPLLLPTVLAMAIAAAAPATAHASDAEEIALLKAQLQQLQARIEQLETRATASPPADASPGAVEQGVAEPGSATPSVDTRGGLKVVSADKAFEVSLGGRVHFDAYAFDRDIAAAIGTTEFRRARLTLQGKAYGWDYKLEQDFAAGSNLDGLRDAYIGTSLFGGKAIIGQFKPYRSMEELTSSNEILMMERPFASGSGLFNGRQFQQGVGYQRSGDHYTAGLSVFNLRGANGPRNEGHGVAGRVTYAPINDEGRTLHLGAWASHEDVRLGSADIAAVANYAGRRGPAQTIAVTTSASGGEVTAHGLEVAAAMGSAFAQSEYVRASFGQQGGGDSDVQTWYVQGGWLFGGAHKPYKSATGVFGSPKVGADGQWELTARYDAIRNRDVAALDVRSWILGLNYYVNPNLRFMLNYTQGDNRATGDETGQYALRAQFAF